MLRIHEILVRIWIRGSISLSRLDPDPAIFVSDLQDVNKKLFFFCLFPIKVHLHNFSKIKSLKEVTKQ